MRSVCVVFAAAVCSLVGDARAKDPPFDPALELQLFDYAVGPKSFFSVPDADLAAHMQFQVDLMLTFLTSPLVVFSFDEKAGDLIEERTDVVRSVLAGQIGGAIGYKNRFQFGIAVPMIFSLSGDGLDPASGNMDPGGLQATGLGDMRAEAKMRLGVASGVHASGLAQISLPTSVGSSDSMFLGDNTPSARIAALGQWRSRDRLASIGATAGLLFRKPREIYGTTVGQQMTYGLAASYRAHSKISVTAETFGRVGFDFHGESMPLEAIAGAALHASDALSITVGGGAGLLKGVGSPGVRMFFSVGYAPDFRDQDGDGIANNRDRCPLIEEDHDNFEDGDGCPELDNDGDKRADVVDKCPLEAEDIDGFDDDDGCPEPDNDGDGLLDGEDRCPGAAEDNLPPLTKDGCPATKTDSDDDGVSDAADKCPTDIEDEDGFKDEDGCPDLDNDGDGLLDEDDQCPVCAEDKDGFEDGDGCPELDNDGDGIADTVDQCPLEAETVNTVDDEDGCPDASGRSLAVFDGERIALAKALRFSRSGTLRPNRVLSQLAAVMQAARSVAKWRIVVVAPKVSDPEVHKANSQRRADAIKQHMAASGVAVEIEAIGAAADRELTAVVALEKVQSAAGASCSE